MSSEESKKIMARNIKKQLELHQMTQTDLCQALGFKFMTVSDWVNAKSYPRIDKIEKMASFFGISKADLVEDDKDAEIRERVDSDLMLLYRRMDTETKKQLLAYAKFLFFEEGGQA